MTLADFEVKLKAHAYYISPGVVALIPKSGTIEELRERSAPMRPAEVMFIYYESIAAYEEANS